MCLEINQKKNHDANSKKNDYDALLLKMILL